MQTSYRGHNLHSKLILRRKRQQDSQLNNQKDITFSVVLLALLDIERVLSFYPISYIKL